MIKDAIKKVVAGETLTKDEAAGAMETIMSGQAEESQIGALITALAMRGETEDEIAGFAETMRRFARPVRLSSNGPLVDTCGTGAGGPLTFNISTAAALVVAGAGARVAKHGNRAITSQCGSADVLEGLGVNVNLEPEQVGRCIEEVGIGFMMAPLFHPAMRFAGPARRALGIRTIFNVLGPLTNPAGARHQVMGVSHGEIAPKMARVLQILGADHALVVHAQDGLDEISISGPTTVHEIGRDGQDAIESYELRPEDAGLPSWPIDAVRGGDVLENAVTIRGLLKGEAGAPRDVTVLNAGAALYAANAAGSIRDGVRMAQEAIDSGAAAAKLDALVELTNRLAGTAP
jgi:anthranilate phosphoribosyltransferase